MIKQCKHKGYNTLPSFGTKWKQPTYCRKHKSPDMKDVVSRRCQHKGYNTLPSFETKWKQPIVENTNYPA